MKAILEMELKREMERLFLMMGIIMKVNGKMIKCMAMELWSK